MFDLQAMQTRLKTLRDSVSQINKTIAERKTKKQFLRPISHLADDAEIALSEGLKYPAHASMFLRVAEYNLGEAERRLKFTQEMISAFGPDLEEVG
jgi:hypothetical protein